MSFTNVNEVAVTDDDTEPVILETLRDAADLASDQDQVTFVTDGRGKRLFAVVPVEFAQRALDAEFA
jgi:hypothetical protein